MFLRSRLARAVARRHSGIAITAVLATVGVLGVLAVAATALTFTSAWGWGVSDGASHFETCSTTCQTGVSGDGSGQLAQPEQVAVDSSGRLYVADTNNERVDVFSTSGTFVQAWGWGVNGNNQFETCTTSCHHGTYAATGGGAMSSPEGVALDGLGNVFVTDTGHNRVEQFSTAGVFIKAWGWNVNGGGKFETCTTSCQAGDGGGNAGKAGAMHTPQGIIADGSGNVFVADFANNRIDEYSSGLGTFTRAWGWGVATGANAFEICTTTCQAGTAGAGSGAMNGPTGVAVDSYGNVFVADWINARIDVFGSTGAFSQAWGWNVNGGGKFETCSTACQAGTANGNAGALNAPEQIAIRGGNLYVADWGNYRIDWFFTTGQFVDAWGWGVADGTTAAFQTCNLTCYQGKSGGGAGEFNVPNGVANDTSGNLFVGDTDNNRIDKLGGASTSTTTNGGGGNPPPYVPPANNTTTTTSSTGTSTTVNKTTTTTKSTVVVVTKTTIHSTTSTNKKKKKSTRCKKGFHHHGAKCVKNKPRHHKKK